MFLLGSVSKNDDKDYSVTCQGPCNNFEVKLTSGSGDPDLYVKPVRLMIISLLSRRLDKKNFRRLGAVKIVVTYANLRIREKRIHAPAYRHRLQGGWLML